MLITIDTSEPINDTDRAILDALIGNRPTPDTPHTPAARRTTPQDMAARIAAGSTSSTHNARSDARLPVTQQAGVTTKPTYDHTDDDPTPDPTTPTPTGDDE